MNQESNNKCFHCGEECGPAPVVFDSKKFCCNGCLSVYRILNENKLNKYYTLLETPGIKMTVDQEVPKSKYAWLDKPEVIDALTEFKDGELSRIVLYIPSIHCSSCIWLLENLHRLDPAILRSMVNFIKKEVTITFNHDKTSIRKLVELLTTLHYQPEITIEQIERKEKKGINRRIIYQIGVAGFAFSNIMLLSLPDYFAIQEGLAPTFRSFFGYINLVLSIPVLFFSGFDYLASAYGNLRKRVLNLDLPIAIGMLTLYLQSLYEVISQTGPGYFDSLAGFVFFLLLGKWYQSRTYQALSFERNYKAFFPVAVTQLNEDGTTQSILLSELKANDRLLIHNNELIPADGILEEGEARINYAFVTGESLPVTKKIGDELYAGGRQQGSRIIIKLTKAVEQSRLTKLWTQDQAQQDTGKFKRLLDIISKRFTIVLLIIAFSTLFFWLWYDASKALIAFVSVLIVACPCAISLTLPFGQGTAMRLMGRRGLYLRDSSMVENISKTNAIVFDKTGTLTHPAKHKVTWNGKTLSDYELSMIRSLTINSVHPLSRAVAQSLNEATLFKIENYKEVTSRGIAGTINGQEIRAGAAVWVKAVVEPDAEEGSKVYISIDNDYKGFYLIKNAFREGVTEMVNNLTKIGKLHIITGDNEGDKERLLKIFPIGTIMNFNLTPDDKLQYVQQLENKGSHVLMIGDGLNDAGALRASTMGVSVADDIYNFSPASDAILQADSLQLLPTVHKLSRKTMRFIKISLGISLAYNIIGLYFALTAQLSPIIAAILMPASSVTVVGFVTGAVHLLFRKWNKQVLDKTKDKTA